MFQTSRAIVLHSIKYSDTSLVVNMYTEKSGRQSFLVQGVYKKNSKFPPTLFQPLTLLDIELIHSPKRELQRLKEAAILQPYSQIPFNPIKSSVVLFLAEILYKSIREEEPNVSMYEFIEKSLRLFDITTHGSANFHLWFVLNLTRFLGFYPIDDYSKIQNYFDSVNGKFYTPQFKLPKPDKLLFAEKLHELLNTHSSKLEMLELNHQQRNLILENLIQYYQIHLGNLGNIKSLQVLTEIFKDK